ncbi:MAG: Stp1/IreP family PP2C-type Ser/Thr phosphatase [Gammaproteobacteria bacterium]|nr:Stp1/IreP family PP2C-type Ser/Thr phosphatase [Gammaproteobacteria bacterium]
MDTPKLIKIEGMTDTGLIRSHNEDSIGNDTSLNLAVLADGMGGHKGGEVASALAVNSILNDLPAELERCKNLDIDEDVSGYSYQTIAIKNVIENANAVIFKAASKQIQYEGMGTTIVVTMFYNNRLTVAHVGDSRMYRLRNHEMEQLTSDHSLLQELIDRGFYTQEEAAKSLNKNLVTRAMGIEESVQVDISEDIVQADDTYLLCSDGLSDMVDDRRINIILEENKFQIDLACTELIQQAKDNGGHDNISVIVIQPNKQGMSFGKLVSKVKNIFS